MDYEILRRTGCYVDHHQWTWTGKDTIPRESDLCNCGRYQWRDRDKAARELRESETIPDSQTP